MRNLATLLTVLVAAGVASAQVVQPSNHLARARAYLAAGQEELALAHARRAADAPNATSEAFVLLGSLLERRGDRDGAIAAYCRGMLQEPGSAPSRERLTRALADGYPARAEEWVFSALPGAVAGGELTFRDPRLCREASPVRRWRTVSVPPQVGQNAIDPKYRRPYRRVCYGYVLQDRPIRWYRIASVHFQQSSDEALARRVAGLLAQLFWTHREYWSTVPDFPTPRESEVWLSREGRAGGEEWQRQIYLYEVGRERSPEEWVRQVSHEFGHTALPAEPIYTDPEPKANGYLAERLLIRWLSRGVTTLWEGAVDPKRYLARRDRPLRARFLNEGPYSPLLRRRDREGMDQYIGMVLAWEAMHGPRMLRAAFDRMLGKNAESFRLGCEAAMAEARPARVVIDGEALLPPEGSRTEGGSSVWVYLPAGSWSLSLERVGAGPISARWDGRPLPKPRSGGSGRSYPVTLARDGWHRLTVLGAPLRITRISLDRLGARPPLPARGTT